MSKIGNYNLILQEQAEELGFSTTQEALDSGYVVVEKQNKEPYLTRLLDTEEELEKAHRAWLKEKESVLADLRLLLDEAIPIGDQDTISAMERAIDFVEACHD